MVQLKVVSGITAGTEYVTRRFPVKIGRSPNAHVTLSDPGVWEEHCRVEFRRGHGYQLVPESDALVSVNGRPLSTAQPVLLRNGDVITVGSAEVQFWLAAARQVPLGLREVFTWTLILLISLLQIGLVYYMLNL